MPGAAVGAAPQCEASSLVGMNMDYTDSGNSLVKVGTQDLTHNQEMAGPKKQLPHMHMDPLPSRMVHRPPEIRCLTTLQMDWTQ
ncbi:hypothetical protein Tco_0242167 [Tanacetum coccineum]